MAFLYFGQTAAVGRIQLKEKGKGNDWQGQVMNEIQGTAQGLLLGWDRQMERWVYIGWVFLLCFCICLFSLKRQNP